jgi:hypothetical protein
MLKTLPFYGLYILCIVTSIGCSTNRDILHNSILNDPYLATIVQNHMYEVQILYTHVDLRDTTFTSRSFHLDDNTYFYPASTVKMPTAILALQKVNELQRQGIDIQVTDDMMTAASRPVQSPAFTDTTTANGKPNIQRYIQKIFAVSDNDAYNRLYEFLGQDYINTSLYDKEVFTQSAICHRLSVSGFSPEENKHTNEIRFFRDGKVKHTVQPTKATKDWYHHAASAQKGIGYINAADSLVMEAFDFSKKNFYSIKDMEATIKRVIFPQKFDVKQRFDLTENDYTFLKKCMSELPKSYEFYKNDSTYYDSYVKFFMFGDSKNPMPSDITIYNKVGDAYGFLIDCAYIENKAKNIGFFLTAVIHVNKNQVYNDGVYEYDEVGFPFMARLGRAVYDYELRLK